MTPPFATNRGLATIPGLAHGFFGRQDGANGSLNMSEALGDDPDHVARNRTAAVQALGLSELASLKQTHSNTVITLDVAPSPGARPEADALVTALPGIGLGILTADCAPVLLADREAGVVGAAHAGWRGAVDGIIANTVRAMESLGARPSAMITVIGPTISASNYEVGAEFRETLLGRHPEAEVHFSSPDGTRVHFDLPGFVRSCLGAAGVGQIEDLRLCTYAEPGLYFSHRFSTHNKTKAGRQIAIIGRLADV